MRGDFSSLKETGLASQIEILPHAVDLRTTVPYLSVSVYYNVMQLGLGFEIIQATSEDTFLR